MLLQIGGKSVECLGCRLANSLEEVHVIYENEHVCCILDVDPFQEGHTLILPKKHFTDLVDLDIGTATEIMKASQKITTALKKVFRVEGVSVCQNGGIFNDLGHYHMHVIPRFKGDGFSWGEPLFEHGAAMRLGETRKKMLNPK
ncbi:HIT family protein [Brevibacillus centrosporus]|uniref:HIT family protein n=1 Tax=Brevibacillus centrosporus TaxID=54910 RepID=UPI002E1D56BC|nr:HIT family protein [Brevibacillus centrosporus]